MNTKYKIAVLITCFLFYIGLIQANGSSKCKPQGKPHDTLTIMIAFSNNIYYYDGKLKVTEAENNFKTTSSRGVKNVISLYEHEANDKQNKLIVFLKIQKYENLNDKSKNVVSFIKENYLYKVRKISRKEALLIKATEEINKQ